VVKFADIKDRYDRVGVMRTDIDRRNGQLADLSRSRAESLRAPGRIDDRYDGTGRLTRVVSPATGAPRYALVEPNGEVRYYVSPAPGVNLQHYVGREVGINGVRGYMPEQRAHHLMAKHVTPLDEQPRLR